MQYFLLLILLHIYLHIQYSAGEIDRDPNVLAGEGMCDRDFAEKCLFKYPELSPSSLPASESTLRCVLASPNSVLSQYFVEISDNSKFSDFFFSLEDSS